MHTRMPTGNRFQALFKHCSVLPLIGMGTGVGTRRRLCAASVSIVTLSVLLCTRSVYGQTGAASVAAAPTQQLK